LRRGMELQLARDLGKLRGGCEGPYVSKKSARSSHRPATSDGDALGIKTMIRDGASLSRCNQPDCTATDGVGDGISPSVGGTPKPERSTGVEKKSPHFRRRLGSCRASTTGQYPSRAPLRDHRPERMGRDPTSSTDPEVRKTAPLSPVPRGKRAREKQQAHN